MPSENCVVTSKTRFTYLSHDNDMDIFVNESIQTSVSDTIQIPHDDNDETCLSDQTAIDSIDDLSYCEPTIASFESESDQDTELVFRSKGLHFCNLNIRHIVPKIDELRITMAHEHCPDVFGMCEPFWRALTVSDDQMAIDGFDLIRKDR